MTFAKNSLRQPNMPKTILTDGYWLKLIHAMLKTARAYDKPEYRNRLEGK